MPNKRKGHEHPPRSGILVSPRINPTGSYAFRVDIAATITGTNREQRQFSSKRQAHEYAERRHSEITRFGHTAFNLTARQREDAARALELVKERGLTLEAAVRRLLALLPVAAEPVTINVLRGRFLAAPGRRRARVMMRRKTSVQSLAWRTARFAKTFGECDAANVTTDRIREWLSSLGELSPVSLNNYRRALHALFAFGVSEGNCVANPVSKIPLFAVPDRAPAILTVEEAERLVRMAAVTNDTLGLLGFVTLGLFGGLRRSEIERIDWAAVKRERRMVTIDGSIAKSGSIRNVPLSENALAWLSLCELMSGRVAPRNINPKLRRLRFLAGIERWEGNELRHSCASYFYDYTQDAARTAAQLGHASGTQLLFEHYRALVPLGAGERFFAIRPNAAPAVTESSLAALPG